MQLYTREVDLLAHQHAFDTKQIWIGGYIQKERFDHSITSFHVIFYFFFTNALFSIHKLIFSMVVNYNRELDDSAPSPRLQGDELDLILVFQRLQSELM